MKKTILWAALAASALASCRSGAQLSARDQEIAKQKDAKVQVDAELPLEQREYTAQQLQALAILPRKAFAPRPKNVILLIGDGMGPAQVTAAIMANQRLNMESCSVTGLSKTNNIYNKITDSAAGGTALATGQKTYNGAISVDTLQRPIRSVLKDAQAMGKATGLVATCEITDATPAVFAVNHSTRKEHEEIAAKMLLADVDYISGGGRQRFAQRKDGRNLIEEFGQKGYQYISDSKQIANIKDGKVLALLADGALPKAGERDADYLAGSTRKALELLSKDADGFFLMVEGSQIDYAGHGNHTTYNVSEVLDFDRAVGEALRFAAHNGETLVVITADHETGGMAVVDGDGQQHRVVGKFSSPNHTASMVPVFAFGPQAERFTGIYENTEVCQRIRQALQVAQ